MRPTVLAGLLAMPLAYRLSRAPRVRVVMSADADAGLPALPDGVHKEVLRSPLPSAGLAYAGVMATVHFTVALPDGTLVRDSRAGEPLEFRVGVEPSEAVLGWDLALPSMRVGEIARVRCAPEYAYGEKGVPPLIPPSATLVFELELLRLRDVTSSNVTEEVDVAKKYREILDGEERTRRAERRADQPDDDGDEAANGPPGTSAAPKEPRRPSEVAAAAAAAAAGMPPSAAEGPAAAAAAAEPTRGRDLRRGWVPESTLLEGEHVNGYTWRENEDEMEVRLPLPAGTGKADVRCEIGARSLLLAIGAQVPLLSGELVGGVHVDGSAWAFERDDDGGAPTLALTLAKRQPDNRLWGYVMAADHVANTDEAVDGDRFAARKSGETKAW